MADDAAAELKEEPVPSPEIGADSALAWDGH